MLRYTELLQSRTPTQRLYILFLLYILFPCLYISLLNTVWSLCHCNPGGRRRSVFEIYAAHHCPGFYVYTFYLSFIHFVYLYTFLFLNVVCDLFVIATPQAEEELADMYRQNSLLQTQATSDLCTMQFLIDECRELEQKLDDIRTPTPTFFFNKKNLKCLYILFV